MSLTNEFMMLIAFELIPVSGWTCLRRFPCDGDDASFPSLRPCSLCRRLSFRLSCLLRLSGEPFLSTRSGIGPYVDRKRTCATLANVNGTGHGTGHGTVAFDRHDRFYSDA